MRRALYVRSVDVLQINFVVLRCTASIYKLFSYSLMFLITDWGAQTWLQ